METKDYLLIIIPTSTTIISFIINFILNKKTYTLSILKSKSDKQLSDIYGIQRDIFNYIDMLCIFLVNPNIKDDNFTQLQKKIHDSIICAGSENAVKLIVFIRQLINSAIDDKSEVSTSDLIAAYVLLAMQVKFDTTGVKTSPNAWYIGRYTTQKMLSVGTFYADAVQSTNNIVNHLKLDSFLHINT